MPDERLPVGVPSTEQTDTSPDAEASSPAGGFLLDNGHGEQPLDGQQLFDRAVAPAPAAAPPSPPLAGNGSPEPIDNVILCRVAGLAAVAIGVIAFLNTRALPLPIILIVGGLVLALYIGSPERLRREHVIDRWDMLVDGATGRREEIVRGTVARIDAQGLSQVRHVERDLAASLLRGGTRPFLIVVHYGNRRLTPYRMHVSVRDYGTSLQTSWYLSYHRGFFEKLAPNPLVALNLFDEQDLRAYVGTVHHCFLDAVVELLTTLGQDTTKLERNSKGFLGIS